jgi:DNA-binding CsgD family transcriptional regulator
LGDVAGCRLSVSLVTDLSETARLTFGGRLDQLSARELEVFQLTIVGATVTEIAASLDLSGRTVEGYRSHLLRKLGCASTTKLLAELLAESVVERARM